MGPAAAAGSANIQVGSNSGGNKNTEPADRGRWQQRTAPVVSDPDRTITQNHDLKEHSMPNQEKKTKDVPPAEAVPGSSIHHRGVNQPPRMKSVLVGPAADKEPLIRVIPSLLKEKVPFIIYSSPSPTPFRSIEILFIDYSTPIPDYFNDSRLLIHLAFALYPQFGDQALKKIVLDYLDSEE
jgi:hypothetical protein